MDFNIFREKLFSLADAEKLEEFEIFYEEGESFKVGVYNREIENYSVNTKVGLGFRAKYNGKMGYAYTEVLDDAAAELLIKSVKENASVIENEDQEVIFSGSSSYSQVDSYNHKLSEMGADEKIKLALEMEDLALKRDERVKSVRHCSVQTFEGKTTIVNSKGLELSHKSNGISAILIPVIKDGDRMNTAVAFRITNKHGEIQTESIVEEAVENALAYIGASAVATGKYRVALRNDAALDLLETYGGIFSAERVQKGLSLLKDKVGKNIASEVFTIIDDPLMEGGMCSCPFDAEGVAAYKKEVISGGTLVTLLHNLKTAAREGCSSTGNASRASFSSPVDVSPSNFYIKPGKKDFDSILKALGNGLLITELQGLHSGANTVSGDFSLAAKGFLVKDGRIERPVNQITVAGNFYSLLLDVEETGSDLRFGIPSGDGCYGSPTLLVKKLSVAGK